MGADSDRLAVLETSKGALLQELVPNQTPCQVPAVPAPALDAPDAHPPSAPSGPPPDDVEVSRPDEATGERASESASTPAQDTTTQAGHRQAAVMFAVTFVTPSDTSLLPKGWSFWRDGMAFGKEAESLLMLDGAIYSLPDHRHRYHLVRPALLPVQNHQRDLSQHPKGHDPYLGSI